jgi:hypothetical protein
MGYIHFYFIPSKRVISICTLTQQGYPCLWGSEYLIRSHSVCRPQRRPLESA